MKLNSTTKALLVAAVIGLGLSGGLAAASLLPEAEGAVAQVWQQTLGNANDQTVGNANGQTEQRGPGEKHSLLSAAASFIGISEAQLRTELGTDKSLADVAVAHGKTRADLIQALVTAQQQNIANLVDRKGIGARPAGPGGVRSRLAGDPLAAAATYLGTTAAELRAKLQGGQTLGQIANATQGKNRDGLIAALVADANAKLDAAQKAGTITAEQATRLKDEQQDHATRMVDGTFPHGPGRDRR